MKQNDGGREENEAEEEEGETEIEVTDIAAKADPSHFELLKVLGQGSFGKVGSFPLLLLSWRLLLPIDPTIATV